MHKATRVHEGSGEGLHLIPKKQKIRTHALCYVQPQVGPLKSKIMTILHTTYYTMPNILQKIFIALLIF